MREVQTDTLFDYRHTQTVLRRLAAKGYVEVEKQGPRRNLWTSILTAKEILDQEVRVFINQVVGLEPENLQVIRDVVDDLERYGPYVAFDEAGLPRALRARLISLIDGFIERKRDRWALAAALGFAHKALDQSPTLARSISLLVAAGGDTLTAALRLLDAVEELLEPEETEKMQELAAIRRELQTLPRS